VRDLGLDLHQVLVADQRRPDERIGRLDGPKALAEACADDHAGHTVFALLKRPGPDAAGVAGASAVDPYALGPDDVAITRTPATYPEAFVRGSALGLGDKLSGHLLIIHGLMDDVVPFRTTMARAERLMLLGKDFDLPTAPAATHAWASRDYYAVYFYRKLTQYFDRCLEQPR
jgi:dipeptidyl-peptidase-4